VFRRIIFFFAAVGVPHSHASQLAPQHTPVWFYDQRQTGHCTLHKNKKQFTLNRR